MGVCERVGWGGVSPLHLSDASMCSCILVKHITKIICMQSSDLHSDHDCCFGVFYWCISVMQRKGKDPK